MSFVLLNRILHQHCWFLFREIRPRRNMNQILWFFKASKYNGIKVVDSWNKPLGLNILCVGIL